VLPLTRRVEKLNARIRRDATWRILMGVGWLIVVNAVLFLIAVRLLIAVRHLDLTGLAIVLLAQLGVFASGWYTAWKQESPLKQALEGGVRDARYNVADAYRLGPASYGLLRLAGRSLTLAALASVLSEGQRAILEGWWQRRVVHPCTPQSIARASRLLDRLARESVPLEEAMHEPDWMLLRGLFLVREEPAGAGKLGAALTQEGRMLVQESTGRVARR
jgi:predicted membrane metal-binding protein